MRYLALLLLFSLSLFAQDSEEERRIRQFSSYYEALVSQALGRYYNASSYLIDARVTLGVPDTLSSDSLGEQAPPLSLIHI